MYCLHLNRHPAMSAISVTSSLEPISLFRSANGRISIHRYFRAGNHLSPCADPLLVDFSSDTRLLGVIDVVPVGGLR